ncbi:hypothetical protein P8452_12490 [Trifolium repens]|nr:hypothetical protein P8452_12490 [Trifolium repens]
MSEFIYDQILNHHDLFSLKISGAHISQAVIAKVVIHPKLEIAYAISQHCTFQCYSYLFEFSIMKLALIQKDPHHRNLRKQNTKKAKKGEEEKNYNCQYRHLHLHPLTQSLSDPRSSNSTSGVPGVLLPFFLFWPILN